MCGRVPVRREPAQGHRVRPARASARYQHHLRMAMLRPVPRHGPTTEIDIGDVGLWHGSGEGHLDHVGLGDLEDPELLAAAVALRATGRTHTFLSGPVS